MKRLGELLTDAGLLTQDQLVQGLQAQVQYGGRLGTNLVELGFISERQLAGVLSEQLGLPYVSGEMVGQIPPAVIQRIPRDVAAEFRVFPVKVEGRTLHVCMDDPVNLQKVDTLGFRLSCSLQPCVVTELTLAYALERYYGVRREARFMSVKPAPESAAAFVHIAEGPAPAGARSVARSEFLSPDAPALRPGSSQGLPEMASRLADARAEPDVLEAMKRFFAALFSQAVVLAVRDGGLVPVAEIGLALSPDAFARIHVAVREDSLLAASMRDMSVHFVENPTEAALVSLCNQVGMERPRLTIVPVLENRAVRMLVVGRGLDKSDIKALLPELKRVLNQIACALQMVALRKQILVAKAG